jgi:hypothetical protein
LTGEKRVELLRLDFIPTMEGCGGHRERLSVGGVFRDGEFPALC